MERMTVPELLALESGDAAPHVHGGKAGCLCAGSVVRGILDGAPFGRCPSCAWDSECSLPRLRAAGPFTRPLFVTGGVLRDGHHRLAVAFERGEESLPVSPDPAVQARLVSAEDVAWVAAEICEVLRPWREEPLAWLLDIMDNDLGYRVTTAAAMKALASLLRTM